MSDFDAAIHAPARLRIMTALHETLAEGDELTFPLLQKMLGMTAGNLTTHLGKLETAGYVSLTKAFAGRKPVTYIALTPVGRAAYRAYRTQLLDLLGGRP